MARICCSFALLGMVMFLGGVLANDVILEFKVLDCYDKPVQDVVVNVTNCQDWPLVGSTNASGIVRFERYPQVVVYCNGNAHNLCQWTAMDKDGVNYFGDITTLVNLTNGRTGAFTSDTISPNKWTGCQCNGDACEPAYTYPQIVLRPKKESCPCDKSCPSVCYAQVGSSSMYLKGKCSSSFVKDSSDEKKEDPRPHRDLLTFGKVESDKSKTVCPEGFMNSMSPCKEGQDCGVCCLENPVCKRS